MKTSESIIKITPAFLKAQKEIESAVKDAANQFFKSNYADLNSVMAACKEALNQNDIAVLQPVSMDSVETILVHSSGEWFSSQTAIVTNKPNDPQAMGSAITYARRYGLQSMVFIGAEDDDAESALDRGLDKTYAPKTVSNYQTPTTNQTGKKCPKCGAEMVHNPKTGKDFCKDKCWLKPAAMPQTQVSISEAEEALTRMVADDIPF